MKEAVILFVGFLVGVGSVLMFQNPRKVGEAARNGITEVELRVETARREQCVREFLDSTHCFQEHGAKECDAMIVRQCGLPR